MGWPGLNLAKPLLFQDWEDNGCKNRNLWTLVRTGQKSCCQHRIWAEAAVRARACAPTEFWGAPLHGPLAC